MRPRLRSFEHAWIDAAFDAIYPEGGMLPHGIASMHPARFFDSVLTSVPFEQFLGIRLTLWMVALAPLFTIRRLGTIASIDAGDRKRVLERLITSRIYAVRQLAMSFKAIATLLYAKSDVIRAAMSTPVTNAALDRAPEPGLVSATRLTSRGKQDDKQAEKSGGNHEHAA